ncbi:MAG: MMPL family transporter [Dehalococcoidia bacterium]
MAVSLSPERLAAFSTRRPWLVLGIWAVILVAGLASASRIGSVLTSSAENYVENDSSRADGLLEARLFGGSIPGTETVVVYHPELTAAAPEFQARVGEVTSALQGLGEHVRSATNGIEAGLISESGHAVLVPVRLVADEDDVEDAGKPIITAIAALNGKDGFVVATGGDASAGYAFTEASKKDLETAEIYGIPIAMVILVIVFGALVAAGLPILLGLMSIAIAVGIAAVIGQQFELSTFLVNFVTTMGLAVGIDYSLLIIQRFREERRRGLERDAAIIHAGATASRAVLFSGMAVIVALAGMLLVPNSIFRSLGVGAMVVVAVSIAVALTLLPAILRLLGDRVNAVHIRVPGLARRTPKQGHSFWDRTTAIVMEHPVMSIVVSAGLLLAAASPVLTLKLGWAGVSTLPAESSARQAFDLLAQEFPATTLAPARIVIDAPDVTAPRVQAATEALRARLAQDVEFGAIETTVSPDKSLALLSVQLPGDPQGEAAKDGIVRLRNEQIPAAFGGGEATVLVTGVTAGGIDDTSVISSHTLPVFGFVLGLSFVILLVVFRSIVVPVKALIMNLLSVGAAYGLMVLVFQHGIGNEIFGFHQSDTIESWIPLFMFATLFGLSMDYHVFLLTRIRERFEHTGDNKESVAYGVRTTAGMITGAAAIMVAVFGGFAAGQMVSFEQMGFGLAVAVLLDATIVRSVLVPASMELLGAANWYLPAWLKWLPKVDVEGGTTTRPEPKPRARSGAVEVLPSGR